MPLIHLIYFHQPLFHSLSILFLNPECRLLLFLLHRVHTLAENFKRKFFVTFSVFLSSRGAILSAVPSCTSSSKYFFAGCPSQCGYPPFVLGVRQKVILCSETALLSNSTRWFVKYNFFLRFLKLVVKLFIGWTLRRWSDAWISLMLIWWKRELASCNSFSRNFFPSLVFHLFWLVPLMVAVGGLTPSRACEVETEVFFLPSQLVDFAEVEKVDILCQAGGSYPAASSAGDGLMLLVWLWGQWWWWSGMRNCEVK